MKSRTHQRYDLIVLLGIVGLLSFSGCTGPTELEGTWEGVDLACDGDDTEGVTIVFTNNIVEWTHPGHWGNAIFSLNTGADPKEMDALITYSNVPEFIGVVVHNIYGFEGDILQIAGFSPGTPPRPTDFDPCNANQAVFSLTKQ